MAFLISTIFWLTFVAMVIALASYASLKLLDVDPLDRALEKMFPQQALRNRLVGGATALTAITIVWAQTRLLRRR